MYFFFEAQMDYLIFLEGLLFLAIGVACYFIVLRNRDRHLAWQYLGLFALVHGAGEWLSLLALSYRGVTSLAEVRLILAGFAALALLEFARIGRAGKLAAKPGRWVLLPFVAAFFAGVFLGQTTLGLVLKLLPMAAGSFWSAYVLAGQTQKDKRIFQPLTILGLVIAAHAILDLGVLFHSNLSISHTTNQLLSNRPIMVGVQLFTNLVVFFGLYALVLYVRWQYAQEGVIQQTRWTRFLVIHSVLFTAILILGWGFTEQAGKAAESELNENLLSQAVTAASAFNPERINELAGAPIDLQNWVFGELNSKLRKIKEASLSIRFAHLLGLKNGSIVFLADADGLKYGDLSMPGSEFKDAPAQLFEAFADGSPFVEGPVIDRWGTRISGYAPIFDKNGDVTAFIGLDLDAAKWPEKIAAYRLTAISITLIIFMAFLFGIIIHINRKLAFASIASEKRFRTIFDNAGEGILIFEKQSHRLVHMNLFALEKLGYTQDDVHSLTVEDIFKEMDPQIIEEMSTAVEQGLTGQVWEAKCRQKNGQVMDVQMTGAQIKIQEQACVVMFSRDITVQKIVEEALRLRTTALESAANSIVITDRKGYVVYVNRAFTHLTGFMAGEIVNRIFSFLHRNSGDVETHRQIWQAIRSGQVWHGEMRDRRKDGSIYPAELTITPVFDDSGAITHFVAMIQDITNRKRAEQQLKYLATHDALTGIPNRSFFEEALKLAVAKAKRGKYSALLLVDLDNFKLVNDNLGHGAGDQVLTGLVKVLRANLREEDFMARLGGDEFAILLDGISVQGALTVSEKLRRSVYEGEGPMTEYSIRFNLSLSGGLTIIDGRLDYMRLLSQADTALYTSKESGRNRITFIESGPGGLEKLNETNQLINLIKNAVRHNGFIQLFHPVYRSDNGEVAFHEAFLQLRGENGELIPAEEFVPVAERYGLISEIDFWSVQSAVRVLQENPDLEIFVNISRVSFADKALLDYIEKCLRESTIEPIRIGFQISESAAQKDWARTEEWALKLKNLGCRLALDQFGLGCSSFSTLHGLPADYLKIEGSFVRRIEMEESYRSMIRAMVSAAQILGKRTVAGHVENEAILKILQEIGIDFFQGNLLGKPVALHKSTT